MRNRIRNGDLLPAAQLPTELELIDSFKVSRTVIRQAMQRLEFEGLIERISGKGTFVREAAPSKSSEWAIGSFEDLVAFGEATTLKILGHSEVSASDEVAKTLHVSKGSQVMEIRGVRSSREGPFAYMRNHLLLDVGRAVTKLDLEHVPMIDAMERADIHLVRVTQWLTAVSASEEESEVLGIPVGTPLLQIQRLFHSRDRGPVEFGTTVFRSDRYRHVSELARR